MHGELLWIVVIVMHIIKLLKSSPHVFLHFYSTRPTKPVRWLSLVSQSGVALFTPFCSSYKYFKNVFFKITILPTGRHLMGMCLSSPYIGPEILSAILLGRGRL